MRPNQPGTTAPSTTARAGGLPERYLERWRDAFDTQIVEALVPGVVILDVGAGRRPTIPPAERPPGCHYIGVDLSAEELLRAPAGSYDETYEADVTQRLPELEGRVDLVVSWQVLEHVRPLERAFENIRAYLRPGGRFVVQFSGRFSVFGLLNLAVPPQVGSFLMHRLLHRDPATVFPAHYDRCWYGALQSMLSSWHDVQILPRYRGASYFSFSRPLQSLYVLYENLAMDRGHDNLATHYMVSAARRDHDVPT